VLDKGTVDCVLCGADPELRIKQLLGHVARLLVPGGRFLVVSFAPPDDRLEHFEQLDYGWEVQVREPFLCFTMPGDYTKQQAIVYDAGVLCVCCECLRAPSRSHPQGDSTRVPPHPWRWVLGPPSPFCSPCTSALPLVALTSPLLALHTERSSTDAARLQHRPEATPNTTCLRAHVAGRRRGGAR
jgi:hypothetical protein